MTGMEGLTQKRKGGGAMTFRSLIKNISKDYKENWEQYHAFLYTLTILLVLGLTAKGEFLAMWTCLLGWIGIDRWSAWKSAYFREVRQ